MREDLPKRSAAVRRKHAECRKDHGKADEWVWLRPGECNAHVDCGVADIRRENSVEGLSVKRLAPLHHRGREVIEQILGRESEGGLIGKRGGYRKGAGRPRKTRRPLA